METLLQDVRYGLRMILKKPGFTVIAVVALALGIGANTAIFSVVNGVLLRPLPYEDPDRLVRLSEWSPQVPGMSISYPNFIDWREQNSVFSGLAATQFDSYNLTGLDEPERLQGRNVSANFFEVLGVKPVLGRTFLAEEDRAGAGRACIISYGLWQRRFGSDPNILGKSLTLNGESYTLVGVLPQSYRYGTPTDVFVPLGLQEDSGFTKQRGNHPGIYAVARLKPGVSFEQAEAEMKGIAQRLAEAYPKENSGNSVTLTPLREFFVGDIRTSLLILLVAVGFVLLIACANVANLLLARATARQKEMAIRTAMGASRLRIIRQLLTESVILSVLSGTVGLLLALWGVDALRGASIDSLPTTADISLDRNVLIFTLLVSFLTGVLFGLMPALQASRTDLNESLKEGGRTGMTGARGNRMRSLLVISEVALSLVLLIGSGLLIKSFLRLSGTETGFNPQNLLTMKINYTAREDEGRKVANFFSQVEQRVKALPGVEAVALSTGAPFLGAPETSFQIEGRPQVDLSQKPMAVLYMAGPDYLRAMGIRLLKGRFFDERDTQNSPLVAVIDEEFARQQFPNQDPLGHYLEGHKELGIPHFEIVGVVSHVRNYGLDTPGPVQSQLYYALNQVPDKFLPLISPGINLLVRTSTDTSGMVAAIRHEVQAIDSQQPIYDVNTMEQVLAESVTTQRFSMLLLSLFAGLALLLAAVGIYGVMSYAVAQRTHEIGIRMAVGAQTRDVLRMVIGQGMVLTLIGVGVGLVGAFALTRVMSSLLFGVTATDPLTFASVSITLIVVALLASLIPARRATKVDPIVALRYE
ncbi:MAG TPA: ABC transporter permease [Pyrinomonadaceae bacterium]|nr:ABC transporter permease [Pyrinomonadaceae bacterium]